MRVYVPQFFFHGDGLNPCLLYNVTTSVHSSGHYKATMGHHLLLRSPKESRKHWALLIISIVPEGLNLQEKYKKPINS